MPVVDHIDNAVRSVTFSPSASVGPFALPWPIYEADDPTELKSDFLVTLAGVVQTNFTVAGTFVDGVAIDGSVTFGAAITGSLIIYSRRRPRSFSDWSTGQAVTATELQGAINGLLASQRDIYDWLSRVEANTVLPTGTFVPTAGGTMSGYLDLVGDPTTSLKAATKQYVDTKVGTVTTKGDLSGFSTVPVRVAVGANGKKLVADSTATPGVSWQRQGGALKTLTDAATINWDMDLGDNAKVTLGGNRTLAAPTNEVAEQTGYLDVIQDGTGSRTLTFDAAYKFETPGDSKINPAIGSTSRLHFTVRGNNDILMWSEWREVVNLTRIYKTADETVTASITYQNDDHLIVPVLANTNYLIEYSIMVSTPVAAGIKVQLTGPAAPTEVFIATSVSNANTGVNSSGVGAAAFSSSMAFAPNFQDTRGIIKIQALVKNGANAGSVTLQWAQNTSSGSSIFKWGSYDDYSIIA
jgi:hypothetical protein